MTETTSAYQKLQQALSDSLDIPEPQWNTLSKIFRVKTFEVFEFVALPEIASK